jgi:hypothetical protein
MNLRRIDFSKVNGHKYYSLKASRAYHEGMRARFTAKRIEAQSSRWPELRLQALPAIIFFYAKANRYDDIAAEARKQLGHNRRVRLGATRTSNCERRIRSVSQTLQGNKLQSAY